MVSWEKPALFKFLCLGLLGLCILQTGWLLWTWCALLQSTPKDFQALGLHRASALKQQTRRGKQTLSNPQLGLLLRTVAHEAGLRTMTFSILPPRTCIRHSQTCRFKRVVLNFAAHKEEEVVHFIQKLHSRLPSFLNVRSLSLALSDIEQGDGDIGEGLGGQCILHWPLS
jgi:hypothetical protein